MEREKSSVEKKGNAILKGKRGGFSLGDLNILKEKKRQEALSRELCRAYEAEIAFQVWDKGISLA